MFDFSYAQFRVSGALPDGSQLRTDRFITSPLATSMYRFRNKLLWNVVQSKKFYEVVDDTTFGHGFHFDREIKKDPYFVTLTVDDEHYEQCFVNRAGSKTIARFLNNLRSFIRRGSTRFARPSYDLSYAWRLERGSKGSQRLHYHLIMFCVPEARQHVKKYVLKHWKYCQWDKLAADTKKDGVTALDHCFTEGDSPQAAAIYACKYSTKSMSEEDCVMEVKNEVRCRLVSSTRDIHPIPAELKPHFNPEEKSWQFYLKERFTLLPSHLSPLGIDSTTELYRYEPEVLRTFRECEDLADASAQLRDPTNLGDAALTELNEELKDSIRDIKTRFSYRQKVSPIYGALSKKQKDMIARGPNPIKFPKKLLIDKWLNHPKVKHRVETHVSSNHL